MIESPFYEMIKQEGREEGLEEGIHLGEVKAQRSSLLDFLEVFGGDVPAELADRIRAETDSAKARRWYQAALRCRSVAEVQAIVEG